MSNVVDKWRTIREVDELEKDVRPSAGAPKTSKVHISKDTAEKVADHLRDYGKDLADRFPEDATDD